MGAEDPTPWRTRRSHIIYLILTGKRVRKSARNCNRLTTTHDTRFLKRLGLKPVGGHGINPLHNEVGSVEREACAKNQLDIARYLP